MLRPALEEVVRLIREEAAAKAAAFGRAPYDALLDGYEPGIGTAEIDTLFEPLAAFLPDFLERVLAHQAEPLPLEGHFPPATQKALGERLMQALGFDFDKGRLDESLHPFCGGVPDDIRMTARYDETDAATGLMAVLHETGHALYNAGLPKDWRAPAGRQAALGSRCTRASRSWSRCRSAARARSLRYLAPLLAESFGVGGAAFAADNLYRQAIRVERGLIRVDADEVTYPLHVILRYRLERALVTASSRSPTCPAAWNEGMRELLGVRRPTTAAACLQDIHWPGGAFGYFPCYTLGAILAAQLFEAIDRGRAGSARAHRQGRLPAAACLAARQRPRAGRPLRDPGADRARHRPPARAAAVPAPPRDALSWRDYSGRLRLSSTT